MIIGVRCSEIVHQKRVKKEDRNKSTRHTNNDGHEDHQKTAVKMHGNTLHREHRDMEAHRQISEESDWAQITDKLFLPKAETSTVLAEYGGQFQETRVKENKGKLLSLIKQRHSNNEIEHTNVLTVQLFGSAITKVKHVCRELKDIKTKIECNNVSEGTEESTYPKFKEETKKDNRCFEISNARYEQHIQPVYYSVISEGSEERSKTRSIIRNRNESNEEGNLQQNMFVYSTDKKPCLKADIKIIKNLWPWIVC